MNNEGYTLAEAAVALLVVGLAVGGLAESARLIGRMQGSAGRTLVDGRSLRAVDHAFSGVLAERGPFRSDDAAGLTGDGAQLGFACGAGSRCSAALVRSGDAVELVTVGVDGRRTQARLPAGRAARFEYGGDRGPLAAWPPAGDRQALRSVALVAEGRRGQETLAVARLWVDQAPDCEFDLIARDCRRSAAP